MSTTAGAVYEAATRYFQWPTYWHQVSDNGSDE
jgi:hypothetical protein